MSASTAPAGGPGRSPSINDVAARAGVSTQTVSRVVNDAPKVAAETRRRVLEAIADLGYRRNPAARALALGRGAVIGVLTPSSALYGPASVTSSLGLAAAEAGVHLAVEHVVDFDVASVQQGLARLEEQFAAGVVVVAPVREAFEALAASDIRVPLMSVVGGSGHSAPDVSVDQRAGARLAVEHLLALGHRTVWHVRGPKGWYDAEQREAGWRDALAEAGREVPPALEGDWSPGSGHRAGLELAGRPEVTAVFAANDAQALGLVRALVESGRSVPDDVSVVGFDDTPESAYFLPPLTTVRQEFTALGRSALAMALQLVEAAPPGAAAGSEVDDDATPVPPAQIDSVVLPPELVVRRSAVAPR